jgi:thiol-disulfide isomerase/thioredoxin
MSPSGVLASRAQETDPAWLTKMPRTDRAAVEATIGFEAPAISEDTQWLGTQAQTLKDLRGKVVVLQTFTTRSTLGRNVPKKLYRSLDQLKDEKDLAVLMIHTPEGADKAERYCSRVDLPYPVMVDPKGNYCDDLGAFKRPVNIIIDRQGNVRFAGLNDKGLLAATKSLLAEKYDSDQEPNPRPEPEIESGDFPVFTNPLPSSADLRGRRAPNFYVENWITRKPDGEGKVVIVDFWATWCGPCVKAIPHMNDLQSQFKNDVVCIGISDEQLTAFNSGLEKRNLGPANLKYTLALDSSGSMKKNFAIRGIPHVAVMSSDWVVRWQGHPANLTTDIVQAIVMANRSIAKSSAQGRPGTPPARWASD